MNSKWFQNYTGDRDKLTDLLTHSRELFDHLARVCHSEIAALEVSPFSDYDSPNWAIKEADRKGQIRAYKNLLSLLTIQGR